MGEAYDRTGHLLGSTEADSAREVLEKLQLKHMDAAEFRIRTREQAAQPGRAIDRMEQFFTYDHLPAHLQAVSEPFAKLAIWICETVPGNPERTTALRKLLEAKDCAVRAVLYQ